MVAGEVAAESLVRLHVNGRELTSLMCTPRQLDLLTLGFLRSEGIIASLADVRLLKVCPSGACVEVWLRRADFEPPTGRTITSGCGGGITFTDLTAAAQPLASGVRVSPGRLRRLMRAMQDTQEARGIHTSALAEGETLLAVAHDIGRHNTIDKLWGYCLAQGIAIQDKILLSSGRISSEMLGKATRMGAPVVVSRTAPNQPSSGAGAGVERHAYRLSAPRWLERLRRAGAHRRGRGGVVKCEHGMRLGLLSIKALKTSWIAWGS